MKDVKTYVERFEKAKDIEEAEYQLIKLSRLIHSLRSTDVDYIQSNAGYRWPPTRTNSLCRIISSYLHSEHPFNHVKEDKTLATSYLSSVERLCAEAGEDPHFEAVQNLLGLLCRLVQVCKEKLTLEHREGLLKDFPDSVLLKLALARERIDHGDTVGARKYLDAIEIRKNRFKGYGFEWDVRLVEVQCLMYEKKFDEAKFLLDALRRKFQGTSIPVVRARAKYFLALKQTEDAVACFKEGLKCYPTHPGLSYELGQIHDKRDAFADAARYYKYAVRKLRDNWPVVEKLASMYIRWKIDSQASQTYLGYLEKHPDDKRAHLGLGFLQLKNRFYSKALQHLQKAEYTGYEVGVCLEETGKPQESFHSYLACILENCEQFEKIMKYYNISPHKSPPFDKGLLKLIHLAKWDEAQFKNAKDFEASQFGCFPRVFIALYELGISNRHISSNILEKAACALTRAAHELSKKPKQSFFGQDPLSDVIFAQARFLKAKRIERRAPKLKTRKTRRLIRELLCDIKESDVLSCPKFFPLEWLKDAIELVELLEKKSGVSERELKDKFLAMMGRHPLLSDASSQSYREFHAQKWAEGDDERLQAMLS